MVNDVGKRLLGRGDWIYVLSLLVPLIVLSLALKTAEVWPLHPEYGTLGTVWLMRSDLLFNLGYAAFWIGLFAVFRRGVPRMAVLLLFHISAVLTVAITVSSHQYLRTTGTVLDSSVMFYYMTILDEVWGAISSETPLFVWLILSAALFYALAGPHLITSALTREPEPPEEDASDGRREAAGRRPLTRREFLIGGAGVGVGAVLLRGSLLPDLGAGDSATRAPVANLAAAEARRSEMRDAAEALDVTSPLENVRLVPTMRTKKRHVALIHLESVRERSVTPYNADARTTPYLDELAKESLFVERAYTTKPHTTDAMASIHAGLHPHPATEVIEPRPGAIPARCLPELLAEHGYRSAWFQSATGRFEDRPGLVDNFGYDHFQAIEDMSTEGFEPSNYLGYEDDIMLQPSREWLEEDVGSPSFVTYLGVTPHHDYLAPTRYGRRNLAPDDEFNRYLNSVRYDDFWTRNIIEEYKRLGIYEETIFVIYGDHGEAFGEHGLYQHDSVPYEEVLRVPLMIHAPGLFDGGERVEGPAQLIDFAPTIIDLLGFEVADGEYPGHSMLDLPEDRVLMFGLRPDLLSLVRLHGREKYIYHFDHRPEEVFDLEEDPLERRNIASRYDEATLEEYRAELLEWRSKTEALYG